ncbi:MAG TPA: hypothetical protein VHM91_14370, partial [Verrucomicrobiales bacterium]|nr:hypothetical protein [Verrucomicrobiales bacterium]
MNRCPLFLIPVLWVSAVSSSHAETVIRLEAGRSLPEAVKQAQNAPKPVKIELAAGRYELNEVLLLTAA